MQAEAVGAVAAQPSASVPNGNAQQPTPGQPVATNAVSGAALPGPATTTGAIEPRHGAPMLLQVVWQWDPIKYRFIIRGSPLLVVRMHVKRQGNPLVSCRKDCGMLICQI